MMLEYLPLSSLIVGTALYWILKFTLLGFVGYETSNPPSWMFWLWLIGKALFLTWSCILVWQFYQFLLLGMEPIVAVLMTMFAILGAVFIFKFYKAATEVENMKIN